MAGFIYDKLYPQGSGQSGPSIATTYHGGDPGGGLQGVYRPEIGYLDENGPLVVSGAGLSGF